MVRILVAGLGTTNRVGEAVGLEVIRRLRLQRLPPELGVHSFASRYLELAYCLLDEWDAAILVDAVADSRAPGTVTLLDLDADPVGSMLGPHPHAPAAAEVLRLGRRLAAQLPGRLPRLRMVACEPADDAVPIEAAIRAVLDHVDAIQNELCVGRA